MLIYSKLMLNKNTVQKIGQLFLKISEKINFSVY